jgi:hypothetical protein
MKSYETSSQPNQNIVISLFCRLIALCVFFGISPSMLSRLLFPERNVDVKLKCTEKVTYIMPRMLEKTQEVDIAKGNSFMVKTLKYLREKEKKRNKDIGDERKNEVNDDELFEEGIDYFSSFSSISYHGSLFKDSNISSSSSSPSPFTEVFGFSFSPSNSSLPLSSSSSLPNFGSPTFIAMIDSLFSILVSFLSFDLKSVFAVIFSPAFFLPLDLLLIHSASYIRRNIRSFISSFERSYFVLIFLEFML